jgi:hypothetical protein
VSNVETKIRTRKTTSTTTKLGNLKSVNRSLVLKLYYPGKLGHTL